MKDRYRLFLRRKSVFYAFDTETNRFESLRTKDRTEARKLLHVKNEACRQPQMNVQLARVYLQHSDPAFATRTWQSVMEEIVQTKTGENRSRWEHIIRAKALDHIRNLVVLETKPADFHKVLRPGCGVSINVYLRRISNFALAMNWLKWRARVDLRPRDNILAINMDRLHFSEFDPRKNWYASQHLCSLHG